MIPPRIFVSHSHKDEDFTKHLVDDLHRAGADERKALQQARKAQKVAAKQLRAARKAEKDAARDTDQTTVQQQSA